MARLLLGWPRMKLWALVPLAAASGCLYLDRINQPPVINNISANLTSTQKGVTVSVTVQASDDDDAPADLPVVFDVVDATTGAAVSGGCDFDAPDNMGRPRFDVTFLRTGIFTVEAQTHDHFNSPSSKASIVITITDAPPAFDSGSMIVPTSARNACNLNTAGDVLTLGFKGGVGDPDQFAGGSCGRGETLAYTWRITGMPSGARPVLTLNDGNGCLAPTAQSGLALAVDDYAKQVCLWTDANLPAGTAMYSVVLEATDGTSTVQSGTADIPVAADAPPCITGTNPVAGSYVVDRTQLQTFGVDSAVDDRDVFGSTDRPITFAWSVWRESDPAWRAVPSYTLASYTLDPSSFGVGEKVRVRVEAIDSTGARATCAVAADDCIVTSCAVGAGSCHKWKTWDLELR